MGIGKRKKEKEKEGKEWETRREVEFLHCFNPTTPTVNIICMTALS